MFLTETTNLHKHRWENFKSGVASSNLGIMTEKENATKIYHPLLVLFTFMELQPPVSQGFFIIDASISHSDTPHSVGLLWTSDRRVAETSN